MSRFKVWIEKARREKVSRIVLALDLFNFFGDRLYSKVLRIMEETSENVCCFKFGVPLVLRLGIDLSSKLIKEAHGIGLPVIVDCKLSDVAHINREMAKLYFDIGFDALTVNPLIGLEGGLDSALEEAEKRDKGVLPLVYMSHRGAERTFGQTVLCNDGAAKKHYVLIAETVKSWKIDGVIVGATRPDIIKKVSGVLGLKIPIYSPGVVYQGGSPKEALQAGSTYLIVGRAIYLSENPREASEMLKKVLS